MGIVSGYAATGVCGEADDSSDYPQTAVSCIVRTQYPYFAQRYAGITCFGPFVTMVILTIL